MFKKLTIKLVPCFFCCCIEIKEYMSIKQVSFFCSTDHSVVFKDILNEMIICYEVSSLQMQTDTFGSLESF